MISDLPQQKLHAVIRDRRDGYRLWRIAEDRGLTIDQVAEVLVLAGKIPRNLVAAIKGAERKK